GRRAHEVPRLGAEVETDLQFRDAPVRLHRRPRVALDGQASVLARQEGCVLDHSTAREDRGGGVLFLPLSVTSRRKPPRLRLLYTTLSSSHGGQIPRC